MFGEAFMNMYTEKNENFKTGFFDIDDCICGVPKGSIITIGARTSMGKTAFAVSICNHLLDMDKKVLFCELEENLVLLEKRFIYTKTKIQRLNNSWFRNDMSSREWNDIINELNYFNNKPLTILCKQTLTTEEIEEKVKEGKPDILFIDSIQCLKMPKAPNMTDAINLAVKEVKRIAAENDLIVVLTSQVSRGTESRYDHRPLLSDLRNSSLLEELSDLVLLLYRPEYYEPQKVDLKGKAEVLITKNRFGKLDLVPLYFYKGIFADRMCENSEEE